MQSRRDGSSVSTSTPTPPNAFESSFLAQLQEDGEPLTAGEAELAGPWKRVPVPLRPGAVAVLRSWEELDQGDGPLAVFLHEETAALLCAALPRVDREPLFHLSEVPDPDPDIPLPGGYPILATFGEQGPTVCGWLSRYQPEIVTALHILEGLARVPQGLAEVLRAAGPGALAQVGRILAARQPD